MSDLENGTAIEQPADDIRSSLADALAQSEGQAEQSEQTGGQQDGSTQDDTRARGADGKFVKKDEQEVKAPATTHEKQVDPAEPEQQQAQADSKEPPAHWSQADKDKFKAQSPESQAFILDRFKAMEGDYTRKTQEIANFRKEYGRVDEMFAPHKDIMRQKGFTPASLIEAWANVETKLASGPDQAIDVIRGLIGGYNIPIEKLASALGLSRSGQPAPQAQQQPTAVENGQVVQLPPEVAAELQSLRDQVGGFNSWKNTQEQNAENARRAEDLRAAEAVQSRVDEFKSAQDEKGNLLHPHFGEVEALMTSLAQAALASKQPVPPLKELYDTAVYANPSTREKLLTANRQQEEAKRAEEARAKAASARRAGSSVTGAPGSGQAPNGKQASDLSLREQLEAAADEAA